MSSFGQLRKSNTNLAFNKENLGQGGQILRGQGGLNWFWPIFDNVPIGERRSRGPL